MIRCDVEQRERPPVGRMPSRTFAQRRKLRDECGSARFKLVIALTEALYVGICVEQSDAMMQAVSKTTRATEHRKY